MTIFGTIAAANIIQKLNFDTLKAIFLLNNFTYDGLCVQTTIDNRLQTSAILPTA